MTCIERQDLILLLAADALEPAERDAIRAHLAAGCPVCAGYLAEANALLAEMPKSLPLMTPAPELRQRLLDRVAADKSNAAPAAGPIKFPATGAAMTGAATAGRRIAWWPTALAAGVAIAVGLAGWSSIRHLQDKNDALRSQLASAQSHSTDLTQQLAISQDELAKRNEAVSHLQQQVREAADNQKFLSSPNLLLVDVPRTPDAPAKAKMTILRDRANTKWLVVADGLQPLDATHTYELWFITPNQDKIPAGTFNVDAQGSGSMLVDIPHNMSIVVTAITDEPAGGSKSPTGKIRIAGPPGPTT